MTDDSELALASCLTARTRRLCRGLDGGRAPLLELVTPTTARLLRWWFDARACTARRFNFDCMQRQAILNTIVAHEVLDASTLLALYWQAAPDALLAGRRLSEISRHRQAHPRYCLNLATGKAWVFQALLLWQLLNKSAALAQSCDDPRFTRHFLVALADTGMHERLLDALLGKQQEGMRDFHGADLYRCAELFVPHADREQVFHFMRTRVHQAAAGETARDGKGMLLIAGPGAPSVEDGAGRRGTATFLAALPELMAFNYLNPNARIWKTGSAVGEGAWQELLCRIGARKGRRFVQMDFSATPWVEAGTGGNRRKFYFPHVIAYFKEAP